MQPPGPEAVRAGPLRLGPYLVVRRLGGGAMGTLYLARDTRHGRECAVKTIALATVGDAADELRARFERESEAARRLHHPGIVTVFDRGEEPGLAWLAMEYLGGHDLTRHVAESGRLPLAQVVDIGIQLAQALAHAHSKGVVHRDIKPGNVVLDPTTGRVKLTDFGVARVADALRTQTGRVLGTPAYMSPEQIAGLALDGRSDLYALGVLLFHLLCASLPHEAQTLGELMRRIATQTAPNVRDLRPDVSEALAAVVAQLLAKRPDARPATADALAQALRAAGSNVKSSRTVPRHNSAD
jgi:eukaryotic-like serine/threonine-protein kinase